MKGLCLTILSVRKLSLFTRKGIYCQIPQGLELRGVGSRVPGCGVGWGGGWRALEGLFQPVLSHAISRTQVAFITAQRLFSGASLPSWTLTASPHRQALPSSSSRIWKMVTQKNVFYLASSVFRANVEYDCKKQSMDHCHIFANLHIYFIQMKALYYTDLCTLHTFCTSFCLFIFFFFFFTICNFQFGLL